MMRFLINLELYILIQVILITVYAKFVYFYKQMLR